MKNISRFIKEPLVIKIQGGLGNQLFQYMAAQTYSRLHGRKLEYDLRYFESSKYKCNLIEIFENLRIFDGDPAQLGCPINFKNRFLRKAKLRTLIYPRYLEQSNAFQIERKFFDDSTVSYLDGYWQNLEFIYGLRDTISSQIVERYGILSRQDSKKIIGVHVRRGDFFDGSVGDRHQVCNAEYYKTAMKKLLTKFGSSIEFHVISNDQKWCKENFTDVHNLYFFSGSNEMEDFCKLLECDSLIISNSSFSWMASFLSIKYNDPNYITLSPTFWMKDIPMSSIDLTHDRLLTV